MELRWTGRETPAFDVKGVQSHTHTYTHSHIHTHRGRGRGQPADFQFPTVSWRKPKFIYHTAPRSAQLEGDLFIFLYPISVRGKKKIGASVREEKEQKRSSDRKTRSCRRKDRRWMLLVLLQGGFRPNLLQDSETLFQTNELNNWDSISK